jgi:hypothetical protein
LIAPGRLTPRPILGYVRSLAAMYVGAARRQRLRLGLVVLVVVFVPAQPVWSLARSRREPNPDEIHFRGPQGNVQRVCASL